MLDGRIVDAIERYVCNACGEQVFDMDAMREIRTKLEAAGKTGKRSHSVQKI